MTANEGSPERRPARFECNFASKVPVQDALAVLSWVGNGISMEDATRLLYPEEAKKIYDPSRWPWGPPTE